MEAQTPATDLRAQLATAHAQLAALLKEHNALLKEHTALKTKVERKRNIARQRQNEYYHGPLHEINKKKRLEFYYKNREKLLRKKVECLRQRSL